MGRGLRKTRLAMTTIRPSQFHSCHRFSRIHAHAGLACMLASCVDAKSVDPAGMSLAADSGAPEAPGPVRQGFEDTELGRTPRGWITGGYGSRTLAVSDELAARGNRAL